MISIDFHLIPERVDGIEVVTLCRSVKFFHTKKENHFYKESGFVHESGFTSQQERDVETGKGLPQTVTTKLEEEYCLK